MHTIGNGRNMALPRISVVTPSYNQGKFIEATIRSVLDQGYPNLEYIIIDGSSTDETVDVIRRYEKHLAYWVSEKDNGAADAISKGFAKATGDILAYLNSDDVYLPGSLETVGTLMRDHSIDVAFGNMYWMDAHGNTIGERRQTRFTRMGYLFGGSDLMQPATFWKRDLYLRCGGIDPSYRFTFDTDLFFRFVLNGAQFERVNKFLASFRIHPQSKSSNDEAICVEELRRIRQKYQPFPHKSLRGRGVRLAAWMYRSVCYALQGDLLWLIGRIPDRAKAPWASEIVGPKGRRV
jgi:glycosyltransferase involved in cell wall biosynthesis